MSERDRVIKVDKISVVLIRWGEHVSMKFCELSRHGGDDMRVHPVRGEGGVEFEGTSRQGICKR